MTRLITTTSLILLLFSNLVHGNNKTVPIDHLLLQKQPPVGIVFEIVSDEDDFLELILPDIKTAITRLRKKFPELPIAIVTHGAEQLVLTSKSRASNSKTHSLVKDLVDDEIEVHVCGTYAGWYGIMPEDFPDYVTVSATGPAQINDYEELGYDLIVLTD